ncbi:MAG: DUF362 domain-containing protein, partial [Desulfobacterales bacterium]|nr:DUF362 domain-containing protein [Desulfobacterales bacterium]
MAIYYQDLSCAALPNPGQQTRLAAASQVPLSLRLNGKSIAIAVGSRRIDRLDTVISGLVAFFREKGARPFIVPAMGSHGGACAGGQARVLASLGITGQQLSVPVCADMNTRRIGRTDDGLPLYFSAVALDADWIVPVNRIKPHTKFSAPIESGLCKMLVIGLGMQDGAAACHRFAVARGFAFIETAAAVLLQHVPVLFGLALTEDGCGQLSAIEALAPDTLIHREKQLLARARAMMGQIPFDRLDILVVDQIGKEISGIGMDSNITGRHRDIAGDFSAPPCPGRIFVRDLTRDSDGNANGIGLADVTTERLVNRMDREKTAVNAVTAISPEKAAIPVYFDTDRQCIQVCMHTGGIENGTEARIVRIRDTASLQYMEISQSLKPEADKNPGLKQISPWRQWDFDTAGNLFNFYPES